MADMADLASHGPAGLTREQEEEAFYHEAALNASWTGSRLAIATAVSGLAGLIFAFFYLRSVNSHGMWYPSSLTPPKAWEGATIMGLVVVSAIVQMLGLQLIKGGKKSAWIGLGALALLLGLAAAGLEIYQLVSLPFQPGAAGFASVFVGYQPVIVTLILATMIWLEILLMRARHFPDISFVEQPPTFDEAADVQRFQANLSSFTLWWNFLAIVAIVFWALFYLVH
jgi:heme/copper-type cytochrome/quinol oxidase subunit 3